MAVIKAQVTFDQTTGLAKDRVINTFHFDMPAVTDANKDDIATLLHNFYTVADGVTGKSLNGFMGPAIVLPYNIRFYNLADAMPRVPYVVAKNLAAVGTGSLPRDVSLVGSFKGAPVSGVPLRRQRGRIYLGVLSAYYGGTTSENTGASANSWANPSTNFVNTMAGRLSALAAASDADADFAWIVYSAGARDNSDDTIPYEDRPLLAAANYVVTDGWVDNEWDTQRGRGLVATTRTAWS